jgi:hypothetical protein
MIWMMRLALAAVVVLVVMSGRSEAALITYELTYSGVSHGNAAVGTGEITIDTALINNPGVTTQDLSPFVTDFTLTISGATSGNGTFGFADFNGSTLFGFGGFLFNTGAVVDFSTDLVPQILDFNIFSNFSNLDAPVGVFANTFATDGGDGELLLLTRFAPVPEPATLTLGAIAGLMGLGVAYRRRRRTDA